MKFKTIGTFLLLVTILSISSVPVVHAVTGYALAPLSGQNGWTGGMTPGFSGNSSIVNTMSYTGAQSWLYNAGTNSPGSDTPFSPLVVSVGAPNQGSFAGDMLIMSFAIRAANPGDGSYIDIYEGSANRDDRTGSHILIQASSGTNNLRLFMYRAIAASPYFELFELGTITADTWHEITMVTVYPPTNDADLTTWGQTTYYVDGVQISTPQVPWPHWWRHMGGNTGSDPYAAGGSFKFTYKSPGKAGFYLDDLSFRVLNTATNKTAGAFHTSFEGESSYPVVSEVPVSGTYTTSFNQITVNFDEDLLNFAGNTASDDVTNPDNFMLYQPGANGVFDTVECSTGILGDDLPVSVDSVTYTNGGGGGPFQALLSINGGSNLPAGKYQLRVCGTTSILNLSGNPLNDEPGTDSLYDFTVSASTSPASGGSASSLPATGFAPGQNTPLPVQPANKAYAATDMFLEIPAIKQKMTIVGVPQTADGAWDVTWLGRNAGWLNGTAFPTWNGNSVITAHVWDAQNQPGPFANLKNLKHGDQVRVHAWGQVYTYEVRENFRTSPQNTRKVMKHEELSWLTLVTCEDYKLLWNSYSGRRVVRAVLVDVK